MRRRDFIRLVGRAAAAPALLCPFAVHAQQPAMPVIGFLSTESADLFTSRLRAFRQGLGEFDFVEGRNLAIEYRWAEHHNERLPALAADLVRRPLAAIATLASAPAALAAKAATTTIPIVFETAADPVAVGLVASLSRPGGNVTGITTLNAEIGPKRLELLHQLVPTATSIAFLVNPTSPLLARTLTEDMQAAGRKLGLQILVLHASTESDLEPAFSTLVEQRAGALVIGPDPFFSGSVKQLAALALRHAVPTISQYRDFPASGGLMSYGGDNFDALRLAGIYTGRVLKGEKPADLPVQQATKVELVINLKTAKALGLAVPLPLLGRADEVIE